MRNPDKRTGLLIVVLVSLGVFISQNGAAANLDKATIGNAIAGKHYQILQKFGKTKVPPGKVEVTEYFWYGCPHCYRLEPYVENWEANKPSYITFRRVAVPFNGLWQIHAQAYYTAERLNLVGKTHRAFFDSIHKERRPLTNQRNIAKFYSEYGVNADRFNEVYNSFGVESKMRLASREVSFYKINSVPMFVVNGKYLLSVGMAGSEANLMEVVRQLAKLEHENPATPSGQNEG